jgi:hypothetical protein
MGSIIECAQSHFYFFVSFADSDASAYTNISACFAGTYTEGTTGAAANNNTMRRLLRHSMMKFQRLPFVFGTSCAEIQNVIFAAILAPILMLMEKFSLSFRRKMHRALSLGLVLLIASSCSSPRTSVAKVTPPTTPTKVAQEANEPVTVAKATRTPWPTLVIPDTPLPPPTITIAVFKPAPTTVPTATPIPPTPTKTLDTLCYFGGNSLVVIGNYLGPPEYYAEFQIGGWQCNIPANTKGYLRMEPGTYDWSATIPVRGRLGKVQGTITVNPGVNSAEIVLCIVEDSLATAPQCPSSGAAPPVRAATPVPPPPSAVPTPGPK